MSRSSRNGFLGPAAALLLIGGATAVGALAQLEPGAHADMSPEPGKIWCPEHQVWHDHKPQRAFDPMRPGPIAPPGKVWVPEHWHFHDLPKK